MWENFRIENTRPDIPLNIICVEMKIPQNNNFSLSLCHSLFWFIYDVSAKQTCNTHKKKNNTFRKFLSPRCLSICYTRDHTVARLDRSIELNPSSLFFPHQRILRIVWQSVNKKLNRCHLYSSTGPNVLARRELTIPHCLFPIDM